MTGELRPAPRRRFLATAAASVAGHGSVVEGQAVFEAKCAGCHGAKGEGKPADALTAARPVKTIGSFLPYAPSLFDYVRMPNRNGFEPAPAQT